MSNIVVEETKEEQKVQQNDPDNLRNRSINNIDLEFDGDEMEVAAQDFGSTGGLKSHKDLIKIRESIKNQNSEDQLSPEQDKEESVENNSIASARGSDGKINKTEISSLDPSFISSTIKKDSLGREA